jgi:hypothetical protein
VIREWVIHCRVAWSANTTESATQGWIFTVA